MADLQQTMALKEMQWIPTGEFLVNQKPKSIVMAVSQNMPMIGKRFSCYTIKTPEIKLEETKTSMVMRVTHIERDVYKVETEKTIYIVNLIGI